MTRRLMPAAALAAALSSLSHRVGHAQAGRPFTAAFRTGEFAARRLRVADAIGGEALTSQINRLPARRHETGPDDHERLGHG